MAQWQFDLYVVSSQAMARNAADACRESQLLPLSVVYDIQQELAHYMGPPWMMLADWLVFGPENGNRVDIIFEPELSASVCIRCDIREEAPQFLVLLSDLTRFLGCRFLSASNQELVEPELEKVLEAIRSSQA